MGMCTLELLKLVGFIFPLILCPSLAEGNVWGFNSSPLLAPHVGCASCQGQERAPVFEVLGHLWGVRQAPRVCGQAPQGEERASGGAQAGNIPVSCPQPFKGSMEWNPLLRGHPS